MSDDVANQTLTLLRRMDQKLDRALDDLHDVKISVTSIEANMGAMNRRLDRMEDRMERLERRAGLLDDIDLTPSTNKS